MSASPGMVILISSFALVRGRGFQKLLRTLAFVSTIPQLRISPEITSHSKRNGASRPVMVLKKLAKTGRLAPCRFKLKAKVTAIGLVTFRS